MSTVSRRDRWLGGSPQTVLLYGKGEAGNPDSMLSVREAALAYLPVCALQGT